MEGQRLNTKIASRSFVLAWTTFFKASEKLIQKKFVIRRTNKIMRAISSDLKCFKEYQENVRIMIRYRKVFNLLLKRKVLNTFKTVCLKLFLACFFLNPDNDESFSVFFSRDSLYFMKYCIRKILNNFTIFWSKAREKSLKTSNSILKQIFKYSNHI